MASRKARAKGDEEDRERVTLRLPAELLERIERVRVAVEKANRDLPVSENALLRMALRRGLEVLEREYH
jgi:hypothetical protein